MEIPKFKIGDKVVKHIPLSNSNQISVNLVGQITSVSMYNTSDKWSYVIRAEKGYNVLNDGNVLSEWTYENHNTTALESELEKVG